jgi:hypothetical protein
LYGAEDDEQVAFAKVDSQTLDAVMTLNAIRDLDRATDRDRSNN